VIRWQLRRRSSNAFSCPLCTDILLKFSLEGTVKKLKRNGDLLITNKVNAGSERQDITSISHLATRRKAGMQFLEHIFSDSAGHTRINNTSKKDDKEMLKRVSL